ncbi:hypothetical protein KIPB_000698 [Kipferlia bialata]|uniref:Uncharacterized protein n=1 Tax=Kipferlia bialata TaxID=797122 RepID=A0A9K3CMT6_9EUKA|nr:hypothetical protein KIPB_000698 [Kipferlia bialata]|eukprot:g698.t1
MPHHHLGLVLLVLLVLSMATLASCGLPRMRRADYGTKGADTSAYLFGWAGIKSFVRGPSQELYDLTTTHRSGIEAHVELERDGEVYETVYLTKATTSDEFQAILDEAGCLLREMY